MPECSGVLPGEYTVLNALPVVALTIVESLYRAMKLIFPVVVKQKPVSRVRNRLFVPATIV